MNEAAKTPPRKSKRKFILRLAGSLISLALLIYLVFQQGWVEFGQALRSVPASAFVIALVFTITSRVFVNLRWYALLRTAGVSITLPQSLRLTFTGLFASNFLPSTVGGDVTRLAGAVYLRMDAGVVAASLIVDRLIGMAGMALLLPAGAAIVIRPLSLSYDFLGLIPVFQRLRSFLGETLKSAAGWFRHPAGLAWGFLATLGHMAMTFLSVWVLLKGAGYSPSLVVIGGLWSIGYFVTLIPISINGLGLQEVSIAYLFSHFGGVSPETALVLAVLQRLLFLLSSLPGAWFFPGLLSSARSEK